MWKHFTNINSFNPHNYPERQVLDPFYRQETEAQDLTVTQWTECEPRQCVSKGLKLHHHVIPLSELTPQQLST